MGQVYLENYEGPLYAFVEFKVGNLTVVSTEEGFSTFDSSEPYSLDHVTNFDIGDTYITNVVMSFSYTKESSVNRGGKSWAVASEFNITVFDESAVFVEDIIANAIENLSYGANCYIEYGWSAQGKKIDERCCSFEGMLLEYTLSFEGSSTVLSITGTITSVVEMSTTYIGEDGFSLNNDITQSGKPSDIVIHLFENVLSQDGSGITYVCDDVEETEVYIEHPETNTPRNFPCYNKSVSSYIINDLCKYSKSMDGRSGYIFYLTDDEDDPKIKHVHFRPQNSVDNEYGTVNENGELNVNLADAGNNGGEITREYDYYAGFQKGEVLSYSSEFKGFAVSGGCRFSLSVDGTTNEMIACEVDDSTEGSFVSPSSACRIMGLSSSSYNGLDMAMRDLWNKYATQVYGATLEILGDPNINVNDVIKLNVYTKYNLLHHTSGEYIVMSIDESVDTSGYTTTLNLMKKGALAEFVTQQLQEETDNIANNMKTLGVGTNGVNLRNQGFPSSMGGTNTNVFPTGGKSPKPIVSNSTREIEKNFGEGGKSAQPILSSKQKSLDTVIGKNSEGYKSNLSTEPIGFKGVSNVADPIVYNK